jgi:hypothetical protein
VHGHDVHFVEGLRAIGTFAHTIRYAILDAVLAEKVAASFQNSVFEVLPTNRAKCKSLGRSAMFIVENGILTLSISSSPV